MNEFENKLIIKDASYQNGFFPQIPNFKKQGSDFILCGGISDDIIVDEHTTTKQIRQGKYSRLVEVSTLAYLKEITINSPSKDMAYSFDIYIKAVIQVKNPIVCYINKNLDIDVYFNKLLSLDVNKITRRYSILDFNDLDDELFDKLSPYSNVDESVGFSYQISAVSAKPGVDAQDYVYKQSTQRLNMELKNDAKKLIEFLANDYEQAIKTEVVEGKLTEEEGIIKIMEFRKLSYDDQIKRLEDLREKGFLTDFESKTLVTQALDGIGTNVKKIDENTKKNGSKGSSDAIMDRFYKEENKK